MCQNQPCSVGAGVRVFMQPAHHALVHVGVMLLFQVSFVRKTQFNKTEKSVLVRECVRAEERRGNNQVIIDCLSGN